MARFIGRYEHSIDPKGRVILPVKFREPFRGGGFLTQHHERCLALWTPDAFEEELDARKELALRGRGERNLARVFASGSHEVELDKQGRMAIPGHLRAYARLDGDVLVNGNIEVVELWNPALWEQKVMPSEEVLAGGDDEGRAAEGQV